MADRDWRDERRRREEPWYRHHPEDEPRRIPISQGTQDEAGATQWGRREEHPEHRGEERDRLSRYAREDERGPLGYGGGQQDDRYRYGRAGLSGAYGYGYGYGRAGERDRSWGRSGERGEERGWWDRTSDEVSSWFGDRDAERRREEDARQDWRQSHRGKGPKGYRRSDERIREDVNDRLTDDHQVDATSIDVAVSNCEVVLSGTVKSRHERRRAEDIAESITGVTHVQNNLRVEQDPGMLSGAGI